MTPEQDAFLAGHRWAVLATVRRGGGVQTSLLAYHWDGHDIVFSTRRGTAKWANLASDPLASVTVVDDQRYLSISGTAERVDRDPERLRLTERLLAGLLPEHAALLQADIDRGLDAARRVVIRVQPERAVGRL
jgi:PPOX class probable F420-dependent enzyme